MKGSQMFTGFFALHALYFFFLAEDGIRALYVTGVQTCALPISARVDNRVALGHRISGIGARYLSGGRRGQQTFETVPPIVDGVKDLVIAASRVDRLQNEELRAEVHHSMRVPRRIFEIDDHGIARIAGIHLEIRRSPEHLIRTDIAPFGPADERASLFNDKFDDASLAGLRGGECN